MRREQCELAITELEDMLAADESAESAFQSWFERHPVTFVSLGYSRSIAHPRIPSASGDYVPDFIAQRPNSAWEIVEIKTPQAAVLRDRDRRSTFYALFEQYLAQCQEYAELFDDASMRATFNARNGVAVQKRPRSVLIAGRSEGMDIDKVFTLASRRTPAIEIYTFDDVRRALESYRTFGFADYDRAEGFSIHATLMLHRPDQRDVNNHILDIGVHETHDRISIFVNPDGFLRLSVWDSNGHRHDARSAAPLVPGDYDQPRFFQFEVGIAADFGFIGIQLDSAYQADIRLGAFPLEMSYQYVLGSDFSGRAGSWFSANNIVGVSRPLSFEEKLQMRHYAMKRRRLILDGDADKWVVFRGHKWLSTLGHPLTQRDGPILSGGVTPPVPGND
jgi:hypothetical protein